MVIESLEFLGGKGCFEHIYLQLVWFVVVVNVNKYHLHRVVWDIAPFNFGDKCNVISRGLKLQHVSFVLEACGMIPIFKIGNLDRHRWKHLLVLSFGP